MKYVLITMIKFYRRFISPLKPRSTCKYYPTCSKYALEALIKYGAIKGSFLSIKRIIKCNPFSKGGYDPLK